MTAILNVQKLLNRISLLVVLVLPLISAHVIIFVVNYEGNFTLYYERGSLVKLDRFYYIPHINIIVGF